jgi:hypothetical protein
MDPPLRQTNYLDDCSLVLYGNAGLTGLKLVASALMGEDRRATPRSPLVS